MLYNVRIASFVLYVQIVLMKCARFSAAARIAERTTVASTLNKLADLNIKVHQYHSQLHSTVGIGPQKTRMGELLLHEQSEFGGLGNVVG